MSGGIMIGPSGRMFNSNGLVFKPTSGGDCCCGGVVTCTCGTQASSYHLQFTLNFYSSSACSTVSFTQVYNQIATNNPPSFPCQWSSGAGAVIAAIDLLGTAPNCLRLLVAFAGNAAVVMATGSGNEPSTATWTLHNCQAQTPDWISIAPGTLSVT